jgi:hypothetical protein
MKTISNLIIVAFLLSILISCEKESIIAGRFLGDWKITSPDSDILTFKNDSIFLRKSYDGIDNSFKYSFDKDSITIQYSGPNMILIQPSTHHYELNSNVLFIDFTNGCYGFESAKYTLTKID